MEALRFLQIATITTLIAFLPLPITHSAPEATSHNYFLPASNANESLFQYKLFGHPEYNFSFATRNDTNSIFGSNSYCNDPNILLETLNTDLGIYGRSTSIVSAHDWIERYTVYFQVYFVISVDDVCGREVSNNQSHYYLSVVAVNGYGKLKDPNRGQVIWTANPDNPVNNDACLNLTESGDLVLSDSNGVAWEVRTKARGSLFFTYEGNLVLYNNDSSKTTDDPANILWQTYDNPTDTLMVLQGLKNGAALCTSNDMSYNKSSAFFSMDLQEGTIHLYVSNRNRCGEKNGEKGSVYWSYDVPSNVPDAKQDTSLVVCWPDPENKTLIRLMAPPDQSALEESLNSTQIDPETCGAPATKQLVGGFLEPWSKNDRNITQITYATFVRLDQDGDLSVYTVNDTTYPGSSATWTKVYSVFGARKCDLPLYCGFYGVCDSASNRCRGECANGFHLVGGKNQTNPTWLLNESSNNRSGCGLNKTIGVQLPNGDCPRKSMRVAAVMMGGVRYVSWNHSFDLRNLPMYNPTDCWHKCADDCACTAAFWEEDKCLHITGNVSTIWWDGNTHDAEGSLNVAYVKYFVSSPQTISVGAKLGIAAGAVFAFLLFLLGFAVGYYRRKRRARSRAAIELETELLHLISPAMGINQPGRFRWRELHEYTCGFSDVLGRGGSGQVFRGSLPDGTPIAVKQLLHIAGSVYEGDKAFVAELVILSKIHHIHLVQLIGFCLERKHKMLVYEYMENGSLDAWLFNKGADTQLQPTDDATAGRAVKREKRELSWERRFSIAVGSAKGLAYLHEDCEERVIHMDMKPQNILLDANFLPKISDFGMSKRIGRDYSYVETVMRGTPGYLAPEWLTDCAVTVKCDVYSFGIVLLEMVSGRRVKDLMARQQKLDLRMGWSGLEDGWMEEVVDEDLMGEMEGKNNKAKWEEARRMVEVAMLCVQREPEKRPSMSSVVQMLEGKVEIPKPMVDHELGLFPSFLLRMMREKCEGSEEIERLLLHSSFFRGDDDESAAAAGSSCLSSRSSSHRSNRRSSTYAPRPDRFSSLTVASP